MTSKITRRDFLNGVALGAGTSLLMPGQLLAQSAGFTATNKFPSDYYPPTLTGMRGSHEGSYEVAHALAWNGQKPAVYQELDEHYDLVVVGAGQSGLAAAWYYRKKMGPTAKILLLDNHDDFGGHAKRNEFHQDGNMVLGLGGAQNIEPMSSYSAMAVELLKDIGDGPVTWLAGASFASDTNSTRGSASVKGLADIGFTPITAIETVYEQKTDTWAVYGQVGYDVTDTVNINGSVRYTDEDREIDYVSKIALADGVLFPLGDIQGFTTSLESNWSGHLGMDWHLNDDAMLQATFSRGFKSGGFFAGFTDNNDTLTPYKEEVNDAYEIGLKSNPSDNLQINAALFFYDYQDAQGKISTPSAASPSGYLTALGTLGDAEHTGFELDALWAPSELPGFSVQLAGSWLEAEISDSDEISFDQLGMPYSLEGIDRDFSPKSSYSIVLRQDKELSGGLLGSAALVYAWRDDLAARSTQLSDTDYGLLGQEGYGILNLRIAVSNESAGWELSVVGENITDEIYTIRATGDDTGSYMDMMGMPATWTLNAQFSF